MKSNKTAFERLLDKVYRECYEVLDDIKFIKWLHREGRDEQAYGFELASVNTSEKLALHMRTLPGNLGIPDVYKDTDLMVKQTVPLEMGFTKSNHFCIKMPLLMPEKEDSKYLESILTPALEAFFMNRRSLSVPNRILIFRHVYTMDCEPWKRYVPANAEVESVIRLIFKYAFRSPYPVDFRHFHCSTIGPEERTEVYVVPGREFEHWLSQANMHPEVGVAQCDSISDDEKVN